MKHIFTLLTLMLVCSLASAQQALWGGAKIVSPQINPDYSVTFRLAAPNAKKVQVTGDFLPTQTIKSDRGEYDATGESIFQNLPYDYFETI